jgi:hypothetical protein
MRFLDKFAENIPLQMMKGGGGGGHNHIYQYRRES